MERDIDGDVPATAECRRAYDALQWRLPHRALRETDERLRAPCRFGVPSRQRRELRQRARCRRGAQGRDVFRAQPRQNAQSRHLACAQPNRIGQQLVELEQERFVDAVVGAHVFVAHRSPCVRRLGSDGDSKAHRQAQCNPSASDARPNSSIHVWLQARSG